MLWLPSVSHRVLRLVHIEHPVDGLSKRDDLFQGRENIVKISVVVAPFAAIIDAIKFGNNQSLSLLGI